MTDFLRRQVLSDAHSWRQFGVIGPTHNIDGWYEASLVKAGEKMYVTPANRADLIDRIVAVQGQPRRAVATCLHIFDPPCPEPGALLVSDSKGTPVGNVTIINGKAGGACVVLA